MAAIIPSLLGGAGALVARASQQRLGHPRHDAGRKVPPRGTYSRPNAAVGPTEDRVPANGEPHRPGCARPPDRLRIVRRRGRPRAAGTSTSGCTWLPAEWYQATRLETRTKECSPCASVRVANPGRAVKAISLGETARPRGWARTAGRPGRFAPERAESERASCDPKDGELCLGRAKPEETLVEVRSDSDVQIDRRTWA